MENPFGEVAYYEYSPDGQLTRRLLPNDFVSYHEYDDAWRVTKVDNRKGDMTVISSFASGLGN